MSTDSTESPSEAGLQAESVADALRMDIVTGVFRPGERLVELQLCERYSCGRAVTRAALVQMESEGLVDRQANRGATVRRISCAEAIEITEARSALESLIAARATRNATASDIVALRSTVADMRTAVNSDDASAYSELNRSLHERLRAISGHTTAAELVHKLRNRAMHHQYRLSMMPGRPAESLEQHASIVDAVAGGDEAAAAAAMADHLASVIDVLNQWGDAF